MNVVPLHESVTLMPIVRTLSDLTFARVKVVSLEMERHAQVGATVSSNLLVPVQIENFDDLCIANQLSSR